MKMIKSKGFITFLFIALITLGASCYAQDESVSEASSTNSSKDSMDILLQDPNLSLKYTKGKFLLYDCYDKHWVCTSKYEYQACRDLRKILLKDHTARLNCSPVKQFSSEKDCQLAQKSLVTRKMGLRTCIHPTIQKQFKGN
jgi:hypothetical protein